MRIGVLQVELAIDQAYSLKEKRVVLNRLRDFIRRNFNVSFAEVGDNEVWNRACLAIVIVANEQRFANQVLSKVVDALEDSRDCVLEDYSLEFL